MKKVPLYTLEPNDICLVQNLKMKVTATKTFHYEGDNSFQQIYLKQVDGKKTLYAPAGLMVEKIE